MFRSKFFTVMIILSFLALTAGVVFQAIEMQDYELFATTWARITGK